MHGLCIENDINRNGHSMMGTDMNSEQVNKIHKYNITGSCRNFIMLFLNVEVTQKKTCNACGI